ncbi:MAG: LysR family transcriptional regulator [Lachnospiraceae bacterium]|nr:LysR family transcriptional regulator [Lachnospiraceae bacterium]
MMNRRPYEYLITIAEKGSLSKAAQALGISQPTLSNFLSGTERQLGHTLFDRSGKILIPTEAGLIYLETCRRILDVMSQTYHAITSLHNQYTESFRVGVTPFRGSQVFSEVFPEFYQKFPDVRIELAEGYMETMRNGLDSGSLSMALGTILSSDMVLYEFSSQSKEELLLCVPSYHPLAEFGSDTGPFYPSIDIRSFSDTPFVMWGSQTTNSRMIKNLFHHSGFTPTIVYESNNALLLNSMLQTGIGVGFLPASFCLPKQNRVYFSTTPPLCSLAGVFYRKGYQLSTAQRYFVYLITRLQGKNNLNGKTYLNTLAKQIVNEFESKEGIPWIPDN